MVERYPTDGRARKVDFRDFVRDRKAVEEVARRNVHRFGPRRLAAIGKAISAIEEARNRAEEKADRSMPGVDPDAPYYFEPFVPPLILPEAQPEASPSYIHASAWALISMSGAGYWQTSGPCYPNQDGYKRYTSYPSSFGCGGYMGYEYYPPNGTGGFWPMSEPIPDNVKQIQVGHKTTTYIGGGQWRTRHAQRYWRSTTGPVMAPWESQKTMRPANFSPQTSYQPIAGAEWLPTPKTWAEAVAEPFFQPSSEEASNPESRDDARPRYAVPTIPGVAVYTLPDSNAAPRPDTQVITVPESGADPRPETRPGPATISRKQTDSMTKERKLRIRGAAAAAWHIINFLSEGVDFLEVLHDALPKRYQARGLGAPPDPFAMADAIYTNFDKIDLASAVENYVNNAIEDYFYGLQGRAAAHVNAGTGTFTGANNALQSPSDFAREAGSESLLKAPEIHFDPNTGEWSLDTPFGSINGKVS